MTPDDTPSYQQAEAIKSIELDTHAAVLADAMRDDNEHYDDLPATEAD